MGPDRRVYAPVGSPSVQPEDGRSLARAFRSEIVRDGDDRLAISFAELHENPGEDQQIAGPALVLGTDDRLAAKQTESCEDVFVHFVFRRVHGAAPPMRRRSGPARGVHEAVLAHSW